MKADDNLNGVTSFAQVRQKQKMRCADCGTKIGHFVWDCFKLVPAERERERERKVLQVAGS